MLDTGCWMLDAGCLILVAGSLILVAGYWLLDTRYWLLVARYWILFLFQSEIRIPKSQIGRLGAGLWGSRLMAQGPRHTPLGECYKVQGIFNLCDIQTQNSVFITLCAMPSAPCTIIPQSALESLSSNLHVFIPLLSHYAPCPLRSARSFRIPHSDVPTSAFRLPTSVSLP